MEINGFDFFIGPGGKVEKTLENSMCCEFHFENEANLRKAYKWLMTEVEEMFANDPNFYAQEALDKMRSFFPELKRWK